MIRWWLNLRLEGEFASPRVHEVGSWTPTLSDTLFWIISPQAVYAFLWHGTYFHNLVQPRETSKIWIVDIATGSFIRHSFVCRLIHMYVLRRSQYGWHCSQYVCHAAEGRTGGFWKMLPKQSWNVPSDVGPWSRRKARQKIYQILSTFLNTMCNILYHINF